MNCKVGDLALIVKSAVPECVGRLANVVEFLGNNPLLDGYKWRDQDCWLITPVGGNFCDSHGTVWPRAACGDASLCPIRDNPGEDETLIYAGLPGERVTA